MRFIKLLTTEMFHECKKQFKKSQGYFQIIKYLIGQTPKITTFMIKTGTLKNFIELFIDKMIPSSNFSMIHSNRGNEKVNESNLVPLIDIIGLNIKKYSLKFKFFEI